MDLDRLRADLTRDEGKRNMLYLASRRSAPTLPPALTTQPMEPVAMADDSLNLPGEIWKPVEGWPYEVSNLGRVRSLPRLLMGRGGKPHQWRGRILRSADNGNGYLVVHLRRDADGRPEGRMFSVHVLVATAFLGPRPPRMQVCHYDGVRTNCRVENLRWDTVAANHADKIRHGTRYPRKRVA